jgi:Holliday junction resolvase RusA-like endonuclease
MSHHPFQPTDAWIIAHCQRIGAPIPAGVRVPKDGLPRPMAQAVLDLERTAGQVFGPQVGVPPGTLVLVLPYPPLANHRYATVQGRRVKTQAHRDYERTVGWAIKEQLPGHQPLTGSLALQVELHRRPFNGRWDKDKPITVIQDALKQAGVYLDDSQIDAPSSVVGTPSETPYVVVTITERNDS